MNICEGKKYTKKKLTNSDISKVAKVTNYD